MSESKETLQYNGWRPIRTHRPPHIGANGRPTNEKLTLPVIPAIRFFDNLAYIGDQFVGCFVLYTSEGLCLIDSLEPGERSQGILEEGLHALGFTGEDVKWALITHGHADHWGCSGYLQERYGAKVIISEIDDAFAKDRTQYSPFGEFMDFPADKHVVDGETIFFGDTPVHCVFTPGHTPGCFSYIIPVFDEGRSHMAALWGGTGLPRDNREALEQYRDSAQKFSHVCDEYHVDVEIATHPFVDNSTERFEVVRNIFDGVANPFVVGREACARYEKMFLDLCLKKLAE